VKENKELPGGLSWEEFSKNITIDKEDMSVHIVLF